MVHRYWSYSAHSKSPRKLKDNISLSFWGCNFIGFMIGRGSWVFSLAWFWGMAVSFVLGVYFTRTPLRFSNDSVNLGEGLSPVGIKVYFQGVL